jgi:hypothetical protein
MLVTSGPLATWVGLQLPLRVDPRFESDLAQPITFFHAVNFAVIEARRVKDLANRISGTLWRRSAGLPMGTSADSQQTISNTGGYVANQAGIQKIGRDLNIYQSVPRSMILIALVVLISGLPGSKETSRSFLSCCRSLPKQPSTLMTSSTTLSATQTLESTSSSR